MPTDLKALAEDTFRSLWGAKPSKTSVIYKGILAALQKAHDAGRREERDACSRQDSPCHPRQGR